MDDVTTLHRLADDTWQRVCVRDPETTARHGGTVTTLPAGGPTQLAADVATARHALTQLAEVDEHLLSTGDRLLTWFLRDHLTQEVAEAERSWYRFST